MLLGGDPLLLRISGAELFQGEKAGLISNEYIRYASKLRVRIGLVPELFQGEKEGTTQVKGKRLT